jgi:hypothetical protein
MILARTLRRGMASDSGTDRAIGTSGPLAVPGGPRRPAGGDPAGRAVTGSACERGGSGGRDQRRVWLPTKARTRPVAIDAAISATQSLRKITTAAAG